MGDPFNRIRETVGPVIHGIQTPLVASAMVLRVKNAVHNRIPHVQISRGHIYFCPEYIGAILEFTCPDLADLLRNGDLQDAKTVVLVQRLMLDEPDLFA